MLEQLTALGVENLLNSHFFCIISYMKVDKNWWKTDFDKEFYKIYYHYLRSDYPRYIKNMVNFADIKKGDRILDLACGAGKHLLTLKKMGFCNLAGLDYNYAKIAEKELRPHKILIIEGDMRKGFGSEKYDFIMIASTSFGYFNDKDNQKVLKNCHNALKSGGKLFIDNLSAEFVLKNFQKKNWTRFDKNTFLLEERALTKDRRHLMSTWNLLKGGRNYELKNKLRLYSKNEFAELLEKEHLNLLKSQENGLHIWLLAEKQ